MGVAAAVRALDAHQLQAKNEAVLDELIAYLQARQEYIPNDRQRRREQHYVSSGHAEKASDLRVARRQKGQGRHWSLDTSDALVALRTLMLNGGWDLYWQHRRTLSLAAA